MRSALELTAEWRRPPWQIWSLLPCRMTGARQIAPMMKPTRIIDALRSDSPREKILVQGWIRTRRESKDFSFIELNDGSSLRNLQIIAKNALSNYAEIQKLSTGASIVVEGALVPSQGK